MTTHRGTLCVVIFSDNFFIIDMKEIRDSWENEKTYVNLHRSSRWASSIDFKALNGKAKITAAIVVRS
jgi:hypothetical protein